MIVEVGLFRIDPARSGELAPVADDVRGALARGVPGLRWVEMRPGLERDPVAAP
jgi:hypothetical protein